MSISYFSRIEISTRSDDLTPGISAAVWDAAWLLSRQVLLGEILGEDAGSPLGVRYTGDVVVVGELTAGGGPARNLVGEDVPWEAYVEAARYRSASAWTHRLQVNTGRELLAQLRDRQLSDQIAAVIGAFPLPAPDPAREPDDPGVGLAAIAAGRLPDGEAAYRHWAPGLRQAPPVVAPVAGVLADDALRDALMAWLAFCDAVVLEPVGDAWDPARFVHRCRLAARGTAATIELSADAHRGGPLDWWAFDASTSAGDPAAPAERIDTHALATRVQFRGMPNPRFFEFEDAAIDFGRVEANPADLARIAVLEFAFVYGNDHFAIPVRLPIGSLCRTTNLLVTDTFGMTLRIAPAAVASPAAGRTVRGSERWTMFTLSETGGTVSEWFCLPAIAAQQVASPPLEDVLCARDEMANVAWAIERLIEGPDGIPVDRGDELRRPPALRPVDLDPSRLRWEFGSTVPPFWFPLVIDPADPTSFRVQSMGTAAAPPRGRFFQLGARIAADALPREGRRLRRDMVSARGANGSAVVWCRRRASVGRGEGSSALAFDRAFPAPPLP